MSNVPAKRGESSPRRADVRRPISVSSGRDRGRHSVMSLEDAVTCPWVEAGSTATPRSVSLSTTRSPLTGVALDGKYYLLGGYAAGLTATCIVYDPISDTWDSNAAKIGKEFDIPVVIRDIEGFYA